MDTESCRSCKDIKIVRLTDAREIGTVMSEFKDSLYDNEVVETGVYDALAEKYAKNAYVIAALLEGVYAGYASFYCNDLNTKTAYLSMIVVKKEYQHFGIGKALMERMKTICMDKGFRAIRLEVDVNNNKARNLYHKCGYAFESTASEHTEYFWANLES